MDAPVWQRYVAAACGHAWSLGVHDTEEVLRCVEALLVGPGTGSATAQVLLPTGVGELVVERRGGEIRIRIRTHATSKRGQPLVEPARSDPRVAAPPHGPSSTPHRGREP